ncbi:nucleotidyltransferase family protein [Chitinophaga vietnamensis]|uniref:nucleotidyltransferase family protein n=1 Tax=Chitinophaga vietnamensis TaxID=2593957 RepID=UPI0011777CBF|nr:nucleotidyltransferase family protein [Chitinophaga vietnamensis]
MLNIETLKCSYTNEETLLILLTRLYFGTQDIEAVHAFLDKEVIDWSSFYKLILHNDIRGFIYDIITTFPVAIDKQIHDTLKKDAMAITLVGAYQARLISQLKIAFEKSGITVIPHKGSALAARYYRAPLLRESSDIDFLINKDDLPELRKCLHENGYEQRYSISAHQMGFLLRFHRELSFKAPKDRMGITCSVELQWKLLERYWGKFFEYDFFVQHLQPYMAMDGTSQVGLAPTYDFLCVASNHLIREPLLKFKYLIDLACMIQISSSELDWEEINSRFKLYNYTAFLWSGMNALIDIVGLQLPVPGLPPVAYHLFTATEIQIGRKAFFNKIRLTNLKRSFLGKIKFSVKARLSILLVPNVNDLSMTNAPAWTIPLIIPMKSFRLLYSYITRKH